MSWFDPFIIRISVSRLHTSLFHLYRGCIVTDKKDMFWALCKCVLTAFLIRKELTVWICAFCWISEFLHFLLPPLPPKNKGEIYSTEEIHFLSLVLTFEENYRSKDLILDNFVLWGFFCIFPPSLCPGWIERHCDGQLLCLLDACHPIQELSCRALRGLLEPEELRALPCGAAEHPCGQPALSRQLRELQLCGGSAAAQDFHYTSHWLLLQHEADLRRRCGNAQDIGMFGCSVRGTLKPCSSC